MSHPYIRKMVKGRVLYEHTLIAEQILNRKLKDEECVHHIDENGHNNSHENLVICPNQQYHALLHRRQNALKVCGKADWLCCVFCGKYDDQKNLWLGKRKDRNYTIRAVHPACNKAYNLKRKEAISENRSR